MAERAKSCFSDVTYQCILPVPLHPSRLRARGFNQAVLLAAVLGRVHHLPLERHNLVRTRWTRSQVGLSEGARRNNVRGAFALANRAAVAMKTVLLVDDIYTSGSTVDECAKVLINAGAKRVDILTLARAA